MPAAGTKKFSLHEIDRLLRCIDELKPANQDEWGPVSAAYNSGLDPYFETRDAESLRNKFSKLKNARVRVDDPNAPEEVKRARLISETIDEKKRDLQIRAHYGMRPKPVDYSNHASNIPLEVNREDQVSVSTVSSKSAGARMRKAEVDAEQRQVARRLMDLSGEMNKEAAAVGDAAALMALEKSAYSMLVSTAETLKLSAESLLRTAEALRLAQAARGVAMLARSHE